MTDRESRQAVVPPEAAGQRVDRFLATALGIARRRLADAFEGGHVRMNGRRVVKGAVVEAGATVTVALSLPPQPPTPEPAATLSVLLEDPSFVAIDKPAGAPSHPLENGELGTVANALVARFPDCATAGADPREAGLVHRLDTETSGVILAARHRDAWTNLRGQLTARTMRKEYLALVAGALYGPARVTWPIGREPGRPGVMRVCRDQAAAVKYDAREAITEIEIERTFVGWTLVRCRIETGVMHQVRVHLAAQGTPVAGDDLYGGARPDGLHRMFLHASKLAFDHPVTGVRVELEAPLPPALEAILAALG